MAETDELTELKTQVALQSKDIEAIKGSIGRIESKLLGNGIPGVLTDLTSIKMQIGFQQPKTAHERLNNLESQLSILRWVALTVGGWTLIQSIQFIISVINHTVTITTP